MLLEEMDNLMSKTPKPQNPKTPKGYLLFD